MPLAVYVLGLSIFAQGTSEFMIAGLLPELSADLRVSIPEAGLLISAFAVGMLVGAPTLAVITVRWPRRRALVSFLAIFVITHVAGALAPNYGVLFGARIVSAFVYAGFWAVATVTTIGLVPVGSRGRAMGVVAGGLTVATVVGLPVGTLVGQQFGWRTAFLAVAALCAFAVVGVLAAVPNGHADSRERPRLRDELWGMVNPRLWLAYAATALTTCASLVTFSYLAPLLTMAAGLPGGWVPAILALYGFGTFLGITIGGRTADAHPFGTLYVGVAGIVALSAALALAGHRPGVTVVLVFLLGAAGFAINPALNARVFSLATKAPTLAASTSVSAFNAGIVVGPWLGGLAIGAGFGYLSVAWIGAALAVLALGTVVAASRGDSGPASGHSTRQVSASDGAR
ncbi:MAG: MFS transporter [Kutzneria sp.]|nr:MFS transporter [Kutzneria sp.]MBV9847225.1 MFS transporter [Kutzneria sp.]